MENYVNYGGEPIIRFHHKYKSLGEFILERLSDSENLAEIINGVTGNKITRENMKKQSLHLASFMREKIGVKSGDIITILSENRPEFPAILFATYLCGAALNALSAFYTNDELGHALTIVRPQVVFVTEKAAKKIIQVLQKLNLNSRVIVLDVLDDGVQNGVITDKNILKISDIMKSNSISPKINFKIVDENIEKRVAFILLSSGTTGLPKCVQISQKNVLSGFSGTLKIFQDFSKDRDIVLLITPWVHNFGLLSLMRLVVFGCKMVYLPRFEDKLYLQTIEKFKISVCFVAPPLMVFFSKSPIVTKDNVTSLRKLYSGGAPLSREIIESVQKRIPNIEVIYNGYGLTETTTGVTNADSNINKPGSIGFLWRDIWGKVIDPKTGKSLPPNTPGELCVKGDQIMIGYMSNEKATRETIDPQGWLHTGDIAYYDENREYYIVGRFKEVIKYKGFQVAPVELESLLLGHPGVRDSAVIGLRDLVAGELPTAFVVRIPGGTVTEQELLDFVSDRVSNPKRLRGGVRFIQEIPKNNNGKIMRSVLKEYLRTKPKL
ncbi:luciferin 4-monooxygenase [Sergentomyia squamirostris]